MRLVVGEIEEEEHEDASLGVQAHEGDHPHPDRDGDVVPQQPDSHTAPIAENGTASMTMPAFTADRVFRKSSRR